MFTQGWAVQQSFSLPRWVQNPHEIVSHGRAKQLQKMPYVAVPCSWISSPSLCCCLKTARDGNSDPPGVDGYTHVFHGFQLLIDLGFFNACSIADGGREKGYIFTLANEMKKKSKNVFPCLFALLLLQ